MFLGVDHMCLKGKKREINCKTYGLAKSLPTNDRTLVPLISCTDSQARNPTIADGAMCLEVTRYGEK